MQPRWHEGIWLGKLWKSDEHILGTLGKMVRARAIRTLPETESWCRDMVEKVNVQPWKLDETQGQEEKVITIPADPMHIPEPEAIAKDKPRGVRVEQADFIKIWTGFSGGL